MALRVLSNSSRSLQLLQLHRNAPPRPSILAQLRVRTTPHLTMKFRTCAALATLATGTVAVDDGARHAGGLRGVGGGRGDVFALRMNSPTEASESAKSYYDNKTPITPDECDHYCGVWYGLAHSGFASAAAHWEATPDSYKLSGYQEGALAFWTGGSQGAGHCTIGAPDAGSLFSTDFPNAGFVGHTTVDGINARWTDLQFAGWARAYFPNGVDAETGLFLNQTSTKGPSDGDAAATEPDAQAHRDDLMTAAEALYAHRAEEHYTEGSERWYGIAHKVKPPNAPTYSDCSSAATWVYWTVFGEGADFLNGESWSAGYTGTMVDHGKEVTLTDAKKGDLVFYGASKSDPSHVAIYIGDDMVISHGHDPVQKESVHYRSDLVQVRSYID